MILIFCNMLGEGFILILNKRPGCHTLSNACVMSRNAAEQYCFFSKVSLIISVIRWLPLAVYQVSGLL
jgi:hypothetical protein